MKNFKKVLALTLALAVIMSSMTVAFAASANDAKAHVLHELGLFQGTSTTSYVPALEDESNAQQALVLIGRALGWPVDMAATTEFTDVATWAAPYVAYAVEKGITNGVSATEFGAMFDGKRMVTWFLRALGYDMTAAWADNATLAATAGLTVPTATTRDAVVGVIYEGLSSTPVGGTDSLIKTIVGSDAAKLAIAVEAGLLPAPKAELTVDTVTALSATQLEVKFTSALDSTDAVVLTKYAVNGVNPSAVSLSSDAMTVTLTFAAATTLEATNAAVVVNPIQSADDDLKFTVRYVGLLTYEDTVAPTITKMVSTTNLTVATSLTVTISEPIKSYGTVKIDGVVKAPAGFVAGATTLTFTGLSLSTASTHTVQIIGLSDQGDNVLVNDTQTFSVTVDKTAPTVSLVAIGDHTIRATFDKSMDVATVTAGLVNGTVKSETLSAVTSVAATVVANTDNKQFDIVISDALYATSTTRTLYVVIPSTLKDSLGNAIAGSTAQVSLAKDTTAPTITKVAAKLDATGKVTGFTVTVSEGLKAGAITPSNTNIVIVDANGVLIPTTGAGSLLGGLAAANPVPTAGATSFFIPVTTPAAKTGVLYFSFATGLFQDMAQTANNSVAANFTVDFGAATSTTTFTLPAGNVTIAGNVITVTYANAVKGGAVTGSATDLNNYTLNGSVLPTGTTITLDSAQKVATITLPAGSVTSTDTGAVFTITNVVQLTGETIVAFTKALSVTDNTKPVMNYAVLNSDNTVVVGFSETLTVAPVLADLTVKINGSAITLTGATLTAGNGLNAGKYVLALDGKVLNDGTVTYVDMDNSGTNNAGDLAIATEASKSATILGSVAVTAVTVTTTGTTGADAAGNVITADTVITVK